MDIELLHRAGVQLDRYREANAQLAAGGIRPDVVFIGDSITELWEPATPALFGPGRINRGIGGQTTPQILARFEQDAIALQPRVLHLMSGTNDIAEIIAPFSAAQLAGLFEAMAARALACGQRVLLGSVLPAAFFLWKPGIVDAAQRVAAVNALLRGVADRLGARFVDYAAALDDGRGGMREGLAFDGVHPTPAGYGLMAPIAERAIMAALREA